MAADVLMTQGVRVSPVFVLTLFSQIIIRFSPRRALRTSPNLLYVFIFLRYILPSVGGAFNRADKRVFSSLLDLRVTLRHVNTHSWWNTLSIPPAENLACIHALIFVM